MRNTDELFLSLQSSKGEDNDDTKDTDLLNGEC